MTLYHFTADWMLPGCLAEGLTKGTIPIFDDPDRPARGLLPGYQWLTSNSDFDQSWCRNSTLPYDRNEWRITVTVPKSARGNLIKWLEWSQANLPASAEVLNAFGDPQNWWLFAGIVKPGWFRAIDEKPILLNLHHRLSQPGKKHLGLDLAAVQRLHELVLTHAHRFRAGRESDGQ